MMLVRVRRPRRPPTAAWLLALTVLVWLATAVAGTAAVPAAAAPQNGPTAITIHTVPPVAGFPVILDGVPAVTDGNGDAHFIAPPGGLGERVTLNEVVVPIDGREVKANASKVYHESDEGTVAELALDLLYRVHFEFSDMAGSPVDASVIDTITVKSVIGQIVDLPAHEDNWLQGSRVVPLQGLLEVKQVYWTVQQVEYSGSNVVNASQQRFQPDQQENVTVKLLFYRVDVALQDAVFGFAQTGEIDLVYPDGRSRRFPLDGDGRLTLPALPRGDYTITTIGAGPDMSRPLALSRNQVVELDFYSWLDIGVVGALILVLAVGLPFLGWRRRRPPGRHEAGGARARDGAVAQRRPGPGEVDGTPTLEPVTSVAAPASGDPAAP
jgi:hypothetical protein